MTIHELLQAAGLTANDEIPIWDADGTGEPTKKITAQQLAAAVVALANLVTSVNNQTGAVSITPANIGAVAKSGDTMTGPLIAPQIYSANAAYPAYLFANAQNTQVANIYYDISGKSFTFRCDPNGQEEHYVLPASTGTGGHYILTDKSPVTVPQGGTGATTAAQARTNLEITPANIGVIVETIQIQFPANQGYVYVNHKSGYNLVQAITIQNDSGTYINGIVDSHLLGAWTLFVSNPPTSTATYSIKLCWVKE